jgi:glycosyltransferase involved in cell wall biosynthesis
VTGLETVFWIAALGVVYPYAGYPLVMWLLGLLVGRPDDAVGADPPPSVSMIIPVHNEASRIASKVVNTANLHYPSDRLQILFVSDGSTDQTVEMLRSLATPAMTIVELPVRGGKAVALNAGLTLATNDILVFSDASIELKPDALRQIVRRFQDPGIGCVSGEDRIAESGGEAWYGKYELFLRTLESRVHSIVGASGSFYAQRRSLCAPFTEGMAPDFLSVLRTVEQGFRAVSETSAIGQMTSVKDTRQEFDRKVRTGIRGMTTVFAHARLLNLFRYGSFAFALWSHKILRWMAPLFMVTALLSSLALLGSQWYLAAFIAQAVFYAGALAAWAEYGGVHRSLFGKIALYFSAVNAALLVAWLRYGSGVRQELWTPTRR